MDDDFPAAHSMDSCFFAIDRDGHVAVFATLEAGALPEDALAGDPHQVCQQFIGLPVCTDALHDPRGHLFPTDDAPRHLEHFRGRYQSDVLMFLRSVDPVRGEISVARAIEVQPPRVSP